MRRTLRCMSTKAIGVGWLAAFWLLLAACAQAPTSRVAGATTSPGEARQVVSGSYDVGYGEEGTFDAKAGRADVTSDGIRYRIVVTGLGQYQGFHELFVYDGHRLLALDPDMSEHPTVYEAPYEHPNVLSFGSGFIYDAHMAPWNHLCGGRPPELTARRVILDRDAVGYACASKANSRMVWFDAASGLLLKWDRGPSVRHLTIDPTSTSDIFSTHPPSGASASVVPRA
jgi:hypothetical protein